MIKLFCIFIVMVFEQLCLSVKTHQAAHFKNANVIDINCNSTNPTKIVNKLEQSTKVMCFPRTFLGQSIYTLIILHWLKMIHVTTAVTLHAEKREAGRKNEKYSQAGCLALKSEHSLLYSHNRSLIC